MINSGLFRMMTKIRENKKKGVMEKKNGEIKARESRPGRRWTLDSI